MKRIRKQWKGESGRLEGVSMVSLEGGVPIIVECTSGFNVRPHSYGLLIVRTLFSVFIIYISSYLKCFICVGVFWQCPVLHLATSVESFGRVRENVSHGRRLPW